MLLKLHYRSLSSSEGLMYQYHSVVWGTNKVDLTEKQTAANWLFPSAAAIMQKLKDTTQEHLFMLTKDACSLVRRVQCLIHKEYKSMNSVNLLGIRKQISALVRKLLAFYIFYS